MTACQSPKHAVDLPAAYEVTWRTQSGGTFTESRCRGCISPFADQVAAEGGTITAARGIDPPPAPIQPEPVGLDAIAPAMEV